MKEKSIVEIFTEDMLSDVELRQINGGGIEGNTEDEPASNSPPGNP